ncbi:MAG: glutathione S-transferase family protein [Steroidobacteraceae bacterium]
MKASYQLYGRPNSGSFAVQVALEEAGAAYERIWVGREPADVEQLRRVIPTGKVPALVLGDGTVMMESAAMLAHLANAHPGAALAPAPGGSEHARFLQWMVFLSANVYEAALRLYYPERVTSRGAADAPAVKAKAAQDYLSHLELLSRNLSPYLLGARYSIADVYLYMLVCWWPEDRAALYARAPALESHVQLVSRRPAVLKVEADHGG